MLVPKFVEAEVLQKWRDEGGLLAAKRCLFLKEFILTYLPISTGPKYVFKPDYNI